MPNPVLVGIGVAVGIELVKFAYSSVKGGLHWNRNGRAATHNWDSVDESSPPYRDFKTKLLELRVDNTLSSNTFAIWEIRWKGNGYDIMDAYVEIIKESEWEVSECQVFFEMIDHDHKKGEASALKCIVSKAKFDPSGSGDVEFSGDCIIKADGTFYSEDFRIDEGDASEFRYSTSKELPWYIEKR